MNKKMNRAAFFASIFALVASIGLPVAVQASQGTLRDPVALLSNTKVGFPVINMKTIESVIQLPEQIITAPIAKRHSTTAKKNHECHLHRLEQGGSPSAPFAIACN